MEALGIVIASPFLAIFGPFLERGSIVNAKTLVETWFDGGDQSPFSLFIARGEVLDSDRVVRRVQERLLEPTDGINEVETFRTAFTRSFSMMGVAGAITAQIAITALSLPQLDSTHWTVQASFMLSLVSGCLCVYYACFMQGILGDLHRPEDLLKWLTRPAPSQQASAGDEAQIHATPSRIPSRHAATMLVTPTGLLNFSLFFLIIGLGLYFILLYTKDMGPIQGENAALATMVVYIIFTGSFLNMFFTPLFTKKVLFYLEDRDTKPTILAAPEQQPPTAPTDPSPAVIAALAEVIKTQEAHLQAQRILINSLSNTSRVSDKV